MRISVLPGKLVRQRTGLALEIFLLTASMSFTPHLQAQDAPKIPTLFLHAVVHAGYEFVSSHDIDALMSPYRLKQDLFSSVNAGIGLRIGFKNILQLEYRADAGASPSLYGSSDDDSITMMKENPKIYLFRFNPVFWLMKDTVYGVFLIYGQGRDGRFLDSAEDGWRNADMKIYGLEGQIIVKWFSGSAGFDYREWTYNSFHMGGLNFPYPFRASSWQLFISIAFGYGL